ncbi:MAG TPA: biotin carboxylase N-terminal domain-containing protein [Methylomirabilota bacterium]|nr:biotin carboxylase N-terminal domain-containing protein [Methylomirabilota bacterium]
MNTVAAAPFSRLLVANRGEIAVRVIRACRELGITTVTVYSEADAGARHVRLADEAVPLRGNTAAESYLDVGQIVAALRSSGAEAVHPGYGFLSENAAFAQAVADAGAVFVGPPPAALDMMGDKLSARLAAEKAGVAVVPGTTVALADAAEVARFGDEFGWPVAIKAAFGGGGRGIRVVASAAEARDAFASAASEAEQGFGHAECYIERYLVWPRHIEIQVFADTHGRCVWLGERECSIQRRHQKLIEEAPAPAFPDETRRAMGEAAVRVAEVAGYVGAGTVEFLYESGDGEDGAPGGSGVSPGNFWFLEMNTRLQVEHPVTEMVTGVDLVRAQVAIAAEGALPLEQGDVVRRGHAIEARVYAEDAAANFLPQAGRALEVRWPRAPFVRVDRGIESGDEVPVHYDPILGKVVAFGTDRAAALVRLAAALDETLIHGVTTNLPFLRALVRAREVERGAFDVEWIEREFLAGFAAVATAPAPELALAAAALSEHLGAVDRGATGAAGAAPGSRPADAFRDAGRWRLPGLE